LNNNGRQPLLTFHICRKHVFSLLRSLFPKLVDANERGAFLPFGSLRAHARFLR
jgi:hypothetical protein